MSLYYLCFCVLAMSAVQNFFQEALAVIFVKCNIYTSEESYRWALSSDTIFELCIQCMRNLRSFKLIFFPYKLPLKKNVNALRLYCTDS